MSVQEDKLKAIADAIREKDGSTETIPASSFPERIRAIPAGGGYIISVESENENMGTVTGGGVASEGMDVTVSAEAKNGYKISEWQEDGTTVGRGSQYSFRADKDRNIVAKFEPSSVPNDYTLLEYIECDLSAYIDSGIKPSSALKIVFKISFGNAVYKLVGNTYRNCYLLYSNYQYKSGTIYYYYRCNIYFYSPTATSVAVIADIGSSSSTNSKAVKLNDKKYSPNDGMIEITLDASNHQIQIGDDLYENVGNNSFSNNMNSIYLFGTQDAKSGFSGKIYSCKLYNGDTILRDFVPCLHNSDNRAGLYDTVGKSFYASPGWGEFIAGPSL